MSALAKRRSMLSERSEQISTGPLKWPMVLVDALEHALMQALNRVSLGEFDGAQALRTEELKPERSIKFSLDFALTPSKDLN
jgi:hypothetical protein